MRSNRSVLLGKHCRINAVYGVGIDRLSWQGLPDKWVLASTCPVGWLVGIKALNVFTLN